MKQWLAPVGWALGMLVLILDGRTALSGASQGVALCIQTLIPSLFPFFLLSAMLTGSLSGRGLLLTGILGGYPVGAGNVAGAYRTGILTRREAERLVLLCNCAGPSFLFGVVGPVLDGTGMGFRLWAVYLLSVLALWAVLPKHRIPALPVHPASLQETLRDSIRAMANVCSWVVLFRVLLAIADRWVLWILPVWARAAVCGILEISNGCLALAGLEPALGFVLAAGMVSFGGLCVMLQTAGAVGDLSLRLYFPGKIFQAATAMLLASFLVPGTVSWGIQCCFGAMAMISGIILRKIENNCGNRRPVIV